MLQSLYLNNFAIIDELTVDFNDGFTVITGETGAGKSILAGSLSFICGNKTDISILKNKEKKATVEAVFTDKSDSVNDFLKKQEIEPSTEIILRRELLPSGASRCYINETNVTVTILKEISFYLIDIHSQHQNLLLTRQNFQLFVLDSIANQHTDLIIYHEKYLKYKQFQSKLSVLNEEQQKSKQQLDFITFQVNELNALTYSIQDFYDAEQESQTLEHAENISLKLNEIIYASHESEHAILIQFKNIIKTLQSLNNQYHKSSDWAQRIESIYFDFKDLVSEIENELHRIQSNPARLEQLQNELSSIYSLLQKHRLRNYDELLSLKEELQTKLSQISNIDEEVAKYEKEIKLLESELETLAHILHTKRQAVSDKLVKNILPLLEKLGMPQAKFIIELNYTEHLMESGKTNVDFLFSANTKIPPQPIEKIASGGEISRLMLSLKTIIAKNHPCETIFFDEIDTGISGEIAYQMGLIMQQLAQLMQVITITHLPQVAACGKHHKLVSKYQNSKGTEVTVKALTDEERINEIAKMLSAKEITKSAIEQAKHLLQIK